MKDILKNIFIGIALLGILWASLAIVALALFAFIMGNIAGGIVSMILIFSIWILIAIIADNKEKN